jgi:hypothetical protein
VSDRVSRFVVSLFIVSMEGVLIATFVLITQNRTQARTDQRDRLNLQVDLLAEQEMTLVLRMLRRIFDALQVGPDDEDAQRAEQLAEETNVYDLMQQLERERDAHRSVHQMQAARAAPREAPAGACCAGLPRGSTQASGARDQDPATSGFVAARAGGVMATMSPGFGAWEIAVRSRMASATSARMHSSIVP